MILSEEIIPLVTVVIPAYNGGSYLRGAIDSVIGQDYPNVELIVLDDGSTDNTPEILKGYGKLFHWDRHDNMGQAATLNKGWRMGRGEVLGYLSADDTLMSRAISTSMQYLRQNEDVIMTYGDFNLIDPQSQLIRRIRTADFDYHDMVANIHCQPGPGVFFWRHAFEAAGGWNSNYRQMPDYDYWLRLGLVGKFHHIPEVLASFRIHDESQTFAKGDPKKSEEPILIITEYFNQQADIPKGIRSIRKISLSSAHLVSAQLHLRAGRYTQGLARLNTALALCPINLVNIRTLRTLFNALFNRAGHRIYWHLKYLLSKISRSMHRWFPR